MEPKICLKGIVAERTLLTIWQVGASPNLKILEDSIQEGFRLEPGNNQLNTLVDPKRNGYL